MANGNITDLLRQAGAAPGVLSSEAFARIAGLSRRVAASPFARRARALAQNISLVPGLRGSGVSAIPQAQLAGERGTAEAGAELGVFGQRSGQVFQATQAGLEREGLLQRLRETLQFQREKSRGERKQALIGQGISLIPALARAKIGIDITKELRRQNELREQGRR